MAIKNYIDLLIILANSLRVNKVMLFDAMKQFFIFVISIII